MSKQKVKQVIVVRRDLKMRRGKEIAQGSHASIAFITRQLQNSKSKKVTLSKAAEQWIDSGFAKVCVRVDSEEELLQIHNKAKEAGLQCHLIIDSGLTEFDGVSTKTCLAIGPDWSGEIDKITGHLKLY